MNKDIDLVVMWVDGSDPEWQKEKNKYTIKSNADGSIYRYRDYGLLKYWFRGVDRFAPWVRKVYFVTWGHLPEWLNTDSPKLTIVKHEDFIPRKYLPTFSANTIENNIHRIKGLSERFILMNDDLYFIDKTTSDDFFRNGLPMDTIALNVHCPKKSLISQFFCINDTSIVNEHFDFRQSLSSNKHKWYSLKNGTALIRTIVLRSCPRFPGFWQHHLATSFLKSTFEEVWKEEPEILDQTCTHKFRETTDVNQWLFKEWQIASGGIEVRSSRFGKTFYIDRDGFESLHKKIRKYITKQQGKMIAINDGEMSERDYCILKKELENSFERILPEKSIYEK